AASPPPFFANDTPTTDVYTLSLHDALPICEPSTNSTVHGPYAVRFGGTRGRSAVRQLDDCHARKYPPLLSGLILFREKVVRKIRSEEHTSELQSRENLVCRLLLEKKKKHST